jgi:phosphoribosylformylglycinamidine cyclo-ligase
MGVDVGEADRSIDKIAEQIRSTWPIRGVGRVMLDIGYFANVVEIGNGLGLASTTDGVGSKTIIADRMKIWNTIGIDCVAMNVNDLICVGATPISMQDYIGVQKLDAKIIGEIAIGLAAGAKQAGISISGGEISQLPDNLVGFDLVGAAYGLVPLDHIIVGKDVMARDVVIGIESNGIHANGLKMARQVLLEQAALDPMPARTDLLGRSIGEELLRPTFIYVKAILDLIAHVPVKALINITGDGLLNLLRIKTTGIGFTIQQMPPRPPIFDLIQKHGNLDEATMFQTFNLGLGFCVVVSEQYVLRALRILETYYKAWPIGYAKHGLDVTINQYGLVGRGKSFAPIPS